MEYRLDVQADDFEYPESEDMFESREEEIPPSIPNKFWNRLPRIAGYDSNAWDVFRTYRNSVTIRTRSPVVIASDVHLPRMGFVRIAQVIPDKAIVVVEHRISLTPPRSIYAAYYPLRVFPEYLNLKPCRGPNPECLAPGDWIGSVGIPPENSTPQQYFFVRFWDSSLIGRNEFRPEFRAEETAPERRRPVRSASPAMPTLPSTPAPTTAPSHRLEPTPSVGNTSVAIPNQQAQRFRELIQRGRPRPPRLERPSGLTWQRVLDVIRRAKLVDILRGGEPPWLLGATETVKLWWRAIRDDYRLAMFGCSSIGFADTLARMTAANSILVSCQFPSDMSNYNSGMFYSASRKRYYQVGCRTATNLVRSLGQTTAQMFLAFLRSTYGSTRSAIREGVKRDFIPELNNTAMLYH